MRHPAVLEGHHTGFWRLPALRLRGLWGFGGFWGFRGLGLWVIGGFRGFRGFRGLRV